MRTIKKKTRKLKMLRSLRAFSDASDKIMATIEKEKRGSPRCETKKLGIITIGPVQLKLEKSDYLRFVQWYRRETHTPKQKDRFKRLLKGAYRKLFSLVWIKNKKVKK